MIRLTINSEQYDYTPGPAMNWTQLLDDISQKYLAHEETIVGAKLDDNLVELLHIGPPADLLKNLQNLELEVISNHQLAQEMLLACNDHLSMTSEILNQTVDCYRRDKNGDAEKYFFKLIDALEVLTHSVEYIQQVLLQQIHDSKELKELLTQSEQNLLTLLKDILKAKEKKDMVLLADLLEYELTASLLKWKTTVVPSLLNL